MVEYDNLEDEDVGEDSAKRAKIQKQEEEDFSGSEDEYQEVRLIG